ncbi:MULTISPECIES: hypothetical protein [Peribacillus]|uniref:hypothetical protein n=1 Tax=Peribacillus sp. FSL E2-0218 TaxID=2921364 RepID=UPI000A5B840E|nr:hypothetical protein [Peribacillus simplex]
MGIFIIRIGFLAEETGEGARAIRSLKMGWDRPNEVNGSFEVNKQQLTENWGMCRET